MSNRFPCIQTKIMAMKGKFLKDEDYARLIAAQDVKQVFNILKNDTIYGQELEDLDLSEGCHRQEIEWRLKRLQIRQSEKFFYYLKDSEKQLAEILLRPLEIASLVHLIRSLAVGLDLKTILPSLVWSERCSTVHFDKLAEAKNWTAFKAELKRTPYYRNCEVYPALKDEQDLFFIEKSIERAYYDALNTVLSGFKGKENRKMVETFRREIDLSNLVWLYRGKFNYHLAKEILMAFALHGGLEVDDQKILNLIDAEDLQTFFALVDTMPTYGFLFHHRKTLDLYMERRRSRYLYYAFQKLFRQSAGAGKMAAFIRLMGFETQDIISIIESKRYGMSDEALEAFLIRDF